MGYTIDQNSTGPQSDLKFLMISSSDHISGATGLTPTVTLNKAGSGSFTAPAGAVTEIGGGWYKVAANATDNGTSGPLLLHATASGADPTDDSYFVRAASVAQTGDSFARLGAPTGASIAADIATASDVIASGTFSAINSSTSFNLQTAIGTVGGGIGSMIQITSGPGVGQTALIIGYTQATKTITIDRAFLTPPTTSSGYTIHATYGMRTDNNLRADIGAWLGTSVPAPNTNGVPLVDLARWGGVIVPTLGTVAHGSIMGDIADIRAQIPAHFSSLVIDTLGNVAVLGPAFLQDVIANAASASVFTGTTLQTNASSVKNMYVVFTGGTAANIGVVRRITDYTSGRQITVDTAFPASPVSGDTFCVVGYGA